jgi:transcriptional regulator of acetoin/glycerol metabolism
MYHKSFSLNNHMNAHYNLDSFFEFDENLHHEISTLKEDFIKNKIKTVLITGPKNNGKTILIEYLLQNSKMKLSAFLPNPIYLTTREFKKLITPKECVVAIRGTNYEYLQHLQYFKKYKHLRLIMTMDTPENKSLPKFNFVERQFHLPCLTQKHSNIEYFIKYFAKQLNVTLDANILDTLVKIPWPGGLRQLYNSVLYFKDFDDQINSTNLQNILSLELKNKDRLFENLNQTLYLEAKKNGLNSVLKHIQKNIVEAALIEANQSQTLASKLLKIPTATLASQKRQLL